MTLSRYVLLMKLTGWRNLPDFSTILLWLSCFHSKRQVKKAQSESLIDLYAPLLYSIAQHLLNLLS